MSRHVTASLVFLCANLVSCGVLPVSPAGGLVSTPPPIQATQAPVAAPETVAGDPLERAILTLVGRYRTGLALHEEVELAHAIAAESRRHDLDPSLVLAVMRVESRFNTFAVSPVGAMGLMQVMPQTGEEMAAQLGIVWYGPQALFDPVMNVRIGVAYLKRLTERYGSVSTALAAYNWGPGHIDRRLQRGSQLPENYPRLVSEAYAITRLAESS